MLLVLFLTLTFGMVSANTDLSDVLDFYNFDYDTDLIPVQHTELSRRLDYYPETHTCKQLMYNCKSPFVVLVLLRTSGRFLGMGSIIDKKTILTAGEVVSSAMHSPKSLLILAGRLCPWWGQNSQVRRVTEIFQNDIGLALVVMKKELYYNKHVRPIKLARNIVSDPLKEYDKYWAVFGIPRSSWDIPGEETSKTAIYLMKIETALDKKDQDGCKAAYPDVEFNATVMACTYANGSFFWGCIGSPTVAVNKANKVKQIAVITRASTSDKDAYHVHVLVSHYDQWVRSHSLVDL